MRKRKLLFWFNEIALDNPQGTPRANFRNESWKDKENKSLGEFHEKGSYSLLHLTNTKLCLVNLTAVLFYDLLAVHD